MTVESAATVSHDRVRLWVNRNKREGVACTPMMMISVEHGGPSNGRLVLNAIEERDLSDRDALMLLEAAAAQLRAKITNGSN